MHDYCNGLPIYRPHAKFGGGLLKLVVVGGAGDHPSRGEHACIDEALGDGLGRDEAERIGNLDGR